MWRTKIEYGRFGQHNLHDSEYTEKSQGFLTTMYYNLRLVSKRKTPQKQNKTHF